MVFYVDLQPKDGKCSFRTDVISILKQNGYAVIQAALPYLRIDTSTKKATECLRTTQPPIISQKTSWSYFKSLING